MDEWMAVGEILPKRLNLPALISQILGPLLSCLNRTAQCHIYHPPFGILLS